MDVTMKTKFDNSVRLYEDAAIIREISQLMDKYPSI